MEGGYGEIETYQHYTVIRTLKSQPFFLNKSGRLFKRLFRNKIVSSDRHMTHQRVEHLLGYAVIDIHFHFWGLGEEISTIFAAVFF